MSSIDRQESFSGTKPVPAALAFDATILRSWLTKKLGGDPGGQFGIVGVEGDSNQIGIRQHLGLHPRYQRRWHQLQFRSMWFRFLPLGLA